MRSAKLCPGSEKDITEVSGTSSPGSIPGRGTQKRKKFLNYDESLSRPRRPPEILGKFGAFWPQTAANSERSEELFQFERARRKLVRISPAAVRLADFPRSAMAELRRDGRIEIDDP